MKLVLEVEGGPRTIFEGVTEKALSEAVLGLLNPKCLVSSTYIGVDETKPPQVRSSAPGLGADADRAPRTKEVSKRALEIARDVLSDGEWHTKAFVVKAWEREGLNVRTADHVMRQLDGLQRSRVGGRAWWRLELESPEPELPEELARWAATESHHHGTWGGNGGEHMR